MFFCAGNPSNDSEEHTLLTEPVIAQTMHVVKRFNSQNEHEKYDGSFYFNFDKKCTIMLLSKMIN